LGADDASSHVQGLSQPDQPTAITHQIPLSTKHTLYAHK